MISGKRSCCGGFQTSPLVSLSSTNEVPSDATGLERRHTLVKTEILREKKNISWMNRTIVRYRKQISRF